MVFLNPSILLGLLASLIPIVIHLLNLRKLNRIEFSTLDFLKELQKNKIKRIKIKQWILLLLRVLIILFIVISFARPTLENASIAGTSTAKTTSIFLLDDSPSMGIIGNNGNFFNESKENLNNLLNQFNEGDELHLLTTSGLVDISSVNIQNIREKLNNTGLTGISGNFSSTFYSGATELIKSDNFNKEIYIFTDKQKSELINDSLFEKSLRLLNEAKSKVYFLNVEGEQKTNFGISNLKANNQIFEQNKPISFSAVVTNYSENPGKNVVASLFMNGERVARQSIDLGPGESKLVNFETSLKRTSFLELRAELEEDFFIADNVSYLSIFVPEQINVAIFYEKMNDIAFLKTALAEAVTSGAIVINERPVSQLGSVNLNNFEVVLICGSLGGNYSNQLKVFVENGGGIVFFPSTSLDAAGYSQLYSLFNHNVGNVELIENETGFNYDFSSADYMHPVFTNLFRENVKPNIDSPILYRYFKYKAPPSVLQILTLEDGTPFLAESRLGNGKALVYNVSPELTSSDFPISGLFAPLVNKGIYYLANTNQSDTLYFTGDKVMLNTSTFPYKNLRVEKPSGVSVYIPADSVKSSKYLKISETGEAGFYNIYSDDKKLDCFVVNIHPSESNLSKYSTDEIESLFTLDDNSFVILNPGDNFAEIISQARFGSELWRLFLIIALVLAIIEMLLARNSKKDIAGLE